MIPDENTRLHEAGHAILFRSFATPDVSLVSVSAAHDEHSAGGCTFSIVGNDERKWPLAAPALHRQTEAAMAITQFGGMAAEQIIRGVRPRQGWAVDLIEAAIRLGRLAGVASEPLWRLAEDASDASSDLESLAGAAGPFFFEVGADLQAGFEALEREAETRLKLCTHLIEHVALAMEEARRQTGVAAVSGQKVDMILKRDPNWATRPPPRLPGFYDP